VRRFLNATGDPRTVITDPQALYYGNAVNDQSLSPGDNPRLGSTGFEDWLSHNAEPVAAAAGYVTDECGRTSATSRPSMTPSPPSTRPSGSRERRSSAFIREDSGIA
jgi:hypothetical protein